MVWLRRQLTNNQVRIACQEKPAFEIPDYTPACGALGLLIVRDRLPLALPVSSIQLLKKNEKKLDKIFDKY